MCMSDLNYVFGNWGNAHPVSFIPKELSQEQLNSFGIEVSDNCSVNSISYIDDLHSYCPFYMLRTYTVTDNFGNKSLIYEEYLTEPGLTMILDNQTLWSKQPCYSLSGYVWQPMGSRSGR